MVTDGDVDVVGRHDLRWTDDHYQVRLDRPPRRSDSLTAMLVVDGYAFTMQDRLPRASRFAKATRRS